MDLRTKDELRAECLAALRREMTRDIGPVSDEDFAASDSAQWVRSPARSRRSLISVTKRLNSRTHPE